MQRFRQLFTLVFFLTSWFPNTITHLTEGDNISGDVVDVRIMVSESVGGSVVVCGVTVVVSCHLTGLDN